MSNTDKLKNKAEDLRGRGKEALGAVLDDESTRNEGRAEQTKANVKQAGEKVKDAAHEAKEALGRMKEDLTR